MARRGNEKIELHISEEGTFALGTRRGTFSVEGDSLKLRSGEVELSYRYKLDGETLVLSGGDLRAEMEFTRLPDPGTFVGRLFEITAESARRKALRLLIIAVVVVAARSLLWAFRGFSRFLINSDLGPLKYVYRRRKRRALTINYLILSALKYAMYLVALGIVLSELGMNYMAYMASLSVIGIAVAFGSQGLVRDMVTGFFIIIEEQLGVGDMVEISGQTGVVEELGLRMTKLRNYQGRLVVIPNRNISTVANYTEGGLKATVDVAAADRAAAEGASELILRTAGELARQFESALLAPPRLEGTVELATGETFVRVELAVWPGQQWVVDSQLVPRIREALKRAGLEIPADRVVVFYGRKPERKEGAAFLRRLVGRLRGGGKEQEEKRGSGAGE